MSFFIISSSVFFLVILIVESEAVSTGAFGMLYCNGQPVVSSVSLEPLWLYIERQTELNIQIRFRRSR